jgi:hypothetical protein
MITQEMLQKFFDDTRGLYQRGEAKFSIDEPCRWSFFFVDTAPSKLAPVADHLSSIGYEIKALLEPDENSDNPAWFLRADRVERHTIESLHARNNELYGVAAQFQVEDYDGMDVGAIDGP